LELQALNTYVEISDWQVAVMRFKY